MVPDDDANHYFISVAAQMLGISEPTAKRSWTYARAWLYNEITKGNE